MAQTKADKTCYDLFMQEVIYNLPVDMSERTANQLIAGIKRMAFQAYYAGFREGGAFAVSELKRQFKTPDKGGNHKPTTKERKATQ